MSTTKLDKRYRLGWGASLRFFLRFLGLTGLLAIGAGALFLSTTGDNWWTPQRLLQDLREAPGSTAWLGAVLVGAGAVAVALAVLAELLASVGGASGRRSAVGANAALQTAIALGIFGAVNVYSFMHSKNFDLTRDHQFTLPQSVIDELRPLHSGVTIVILQQHKTFGQFSANPDQYDFAAEKEVVQKIKDRIDKFREFGPSFKVDVLNVGERDFDNKVNELTKVRPGLREAIQTAPDNSIFFYSDPDVVEWTESDVLRLNPALKLRVPESDKFLVYQSFIQRLSFNEFYMLDKTESKRANDGNGNLVLQPQGLAPVLRRITANQEKKPRVALASCHEALSSSTSEATPDEYSHNGLRKALEEHGFEVVDLILKKEDEQEFKPASYNIAEKNVIKYRSRLDSVVARINEARDDRKVLLDTVELFKNPETVLRQALNEKLNRPPTQVELQREMEGLKALYQARTGRELTDAERKRYVDSRLREVAEIDEEDIPKLEERRKQAEKQLDEALKDERGLEDQRVTDIEAKMTRILDDCDLLIIPRPTLINLHAGMMIGAGFFALRDKNENENDPRFVPSKTLAKQVKVIRDFIKRGKPVLACFGPTNRFNGRNVPSTGRPLDDMEKIIGEMGIELGRQTVLYNAEEDDFAEDDIDNNFGTGGNSLIPDVEFRASKTGGPLHPIAEAMAVIRRSADKDLKIKIRHPRPLYLHPNLASRQVGPEFLFTSPECWNEDRPFKEQGRLPGGQRVTIYTPSFHPIRSFSDSRKGTHDEERRGPFTIGLALELYPPIDWYDEKYTGYKEVSGLVGALDNGLASVGLTASAMLQKKGDKLVAREERPLTRIVVIGHGGLFSGKQLSPATEKFLLTTCNWLLHREDRLPKSSEETPVKNEAEAKAAPEIEKPWKYPRVTLEDGAVRFARGLAKRQRDLAKETAEKLDEVLMKGDSERKKITEDVLQKIAEEQRKLNNEASQLRNDDASKALQEARDAMIKAEEAATAKKLAETATYQREAADALDEVAKQVGKQAAKKLKSIWRWGTFIGIPAIFAYLGLVVLMFRRVR
jgi:hypothetical protein